MTGRPFSALVMGGAGVFGSSICRMLAERGDMQIIVAGRSSRRAEDTAGRIRSHHPEADIRAMACDKTTALTAALRRSGADLLIDAAGPFQGRDYAVAESCIAQGVHYIDLADARDFVTGFERLDAAARAAGVLAVSGASSVPGLSSAAADQLSRDLAAVERIAIAILPGNRAPRGQAVVVAILGYVGQPIPGWRDGARVILRGWQNLRRVRLRLPEGTDLGRRWAAACDVPDTVLFPKRYAGVSTVTFHAGLELGLMHFGLWALSWPVRWGLLRSLTPLAPLAYRIAVALERWGTDRGGMMVELRGSRSDGTVANRRWTLIAESGDGPQVPAVPAVILAGKLAGGWAVTGAVPCLGLFDLAEFERAVTGLDIRCAAEETGA